MNSIHNSSERRTDAFNGRKVLSLMKEQGEETNKRGTIVESVYIEREKKERKKKEKGGRGMEG